MSSFQQWASSDTAPNVPVNENFDALAGAGLYAHRKDGDSGLVYGLMGGVFQDSVKADTTTTLTNNATNYVVANLSTGAITNATSTTNWNDSSNYARVAKIVTASGAISTVTDYRFDEFGLFQSMSGGGGGGGSGTPGGNETEVQFNNGSSGFGASSEFTWNPSTLLATIRRVIVGSVDGDANGIAGDDLHWVNISNDPSVVAGLGSAGLQLLRINSYGSAGYGGNVHFCRYRGTKASPTAVQSGDFFQSFGYRGWDSSAALSQSAAAFQVIATENWTGSAHGIKFRWETTPNGSTTRAVGMELDGNGRLSPNALVCDMTTLTDAANIATNAGTGNNFRVTLGGNRTLDNPTNLSDGQVLNWKVKQDGTGSRTLAYGSKFKWPGGSAPTLSTAASAIDVISAIYDSTDDILMCAIQKAFA